LEMEEMKIELEMATDRVQKGVGTKKDAAFLKSWKLKKYEADLAILLLLEEVRPKLLHQLDEEAVELGGDEAVSGGEALVLRKRLQSRSEKGERKLNRNPRAIAAIRIRAVN
jgi:hypothetical protein